MTEPVALIKQVKKRFEPDETLVQFLEKLLEDAKSGKLTALATAEVRHDDLEPGGDVTTSYHNKAFTGWALDSAIAQLHVQYFVMKYLNPPNN